MLSFHPSKVASVDRIAEDAVCMTLAIPPACASSSISTPDST